MNKWIYQHFPDLMGMEKAVFHLAVSENCFHQTLRNKENSLYNFSTHLIPMCLPVNLYFFCAVNAEQ